MPVHSARRMEPIRGFGRTGSGGLPGAHLGGAEDRFQIGDAEKAEPVAQGDHASLACRMIPWLMPLHRGGRH